MDRRFVNTNLVAELQLKEKNEARKLEELANAITRQTPELKNLSREAGLVSSKPMIHELTKHIPFTNGFQFTK